MKKWVFLGFIAVLVIWLAGAFLTLPGVESSLTSAAKTLLEKPEYLKAFDEVKVKFSGQEALLSGIVTTEADKAAAGKLIADEVRVSSWFGSGLNPVISVANGIEVDAARAYAKPLPWLVVSAFEDQVRLSGVVGNEASTKSVNEAFAKLAPAGKFVTLVRDSADARPAKDLAATLKNLPDLKAALSKAKEGEGVVAVSACDGTWKMLSGNQEHSAIAENLAASATPISLVTNALLDLGAWQTNLREKARIATLPVAVAAVSLLPNAVHTFGAVGSVNDQKALIDGLTAKYKPVAVTDHTSLSGDVKPDANWAASLATLPGKSDPASAAVMKSGEKALVWSGKDAAEGMKKELASALPKGLEIAVIQETLDTYAKEKKAADEVAAKAAAEKLAADKAKAEADAKAAADKAKMAPPAPTTPATATPATATPATATTAPAAQSAAVTPASPAYLGWTVSAGTVSLFGALPNNEALASANKAAEAAYPGSKINADGIIIDVKRTAPAGATAKFAASTDASKPQVGLAALGSDAKTYSVDVFDSEIAKDWPQLGFTENELASSLRGFREQQLKAGSLKLDEPYLSVISDGKKLTIVGEVSDAATKEKLLADIKAANPGFTVEDHLAATPLVRATADLASTLSSLPKFEAGKSTVVAAKPGEKARAGVLHAIYFASGSDRSKDKERALYQVRRVLTLAPTSKIEVVGNSDNVGSADANTKLSQERADKFGDYLVAAGIDKSIFTTRGAGPTAPIADNATDAGKALNRRVDVLVK